MKNEAWFHLTIPQIEKKLKTNAASGLSRKAARSRVDREAGGLFLMPRQSPLTMLAELAADVALLILILTALISLFFEDGFFNGLTVTLLGVGYGAVTGYLLYRSRRTVESYAGLFAPTVHVIRGGRLFCVDFRSVVVGDVLLAEKGDRLCCDARIVHSERLRVRMQVNRREWRTLEKASDAYVNPKEHRAVEMTNMLHAGSVIEEGSARAIVTAVGKYTYLGAMTGGIPLPSVYAPIKRIQALRKRCAKVNMLALLAVLPFTLLSLLFNKIDGGHAWLSVSFLTAIAIAATTMSQLGCTVLQFFYIRRMRTLLRGSHAAVRSAEAFERLSETDYIFMTDGCLMTDGRLHFEAAACAEGELRDGSFSGATAKRFLELVALYCSAATGSLSSGVSDSSDYLPALRELISASGVDEGSMRIRCSVLSYAPAGLSDSAEQLWFAEGGVRQCLRVSCSPAALAECGSVMINGSVQPLSTAGRTQLEQRWLQYTSLRQTPMVFTLSYAAEAPCFVGMVTLREGVVPELLAQIARLEKTGCRVICFSRSESSAPKLPSELLERGMARKKDFLDRGLPFTYRFGSFRTYADFENEDVLTLLRYVQGQGKRVVAVGFTEESLFLAEHADGFLTCSPLYVSDGGRWNEELQSAELSGRQYSATCTPAVKERAEYLIARPTKNGGGIAALTALMRKAKGMRQSMDDLLRYWIQTQGIRVLVTALPMLFGQTILDARHILFFGFVMDSFALALFVCDRDRGARQRLVQEDAWRERTVWLPAAIASLSCLILPYLPQWLGIGERYFYRTEFCFSAVLWLHISALLCCRCREDAREWRAILRRAPLILAVLTAAFVMLVCSLYTPVGNLLSWEALPWQYLLLSFAPAALLAAIFLGLKRLSK